MYSDGSKKIARLIIRTKYWIQRTSTIILGSRKHTINTSLWKLKPNIFSHIILGCTIYLLKRNIKCRHNSCFKFKFRTQIIFGIIEFEIDNLINFIGILLSQEIKDIEKICVIL